MKRIVWALAAAILLGSPAMGANWLSLFEGKDGTIVYGDAETVQLVGPDTVRIWLKYHLARPEDGVVEIVSHTLFFCEDRTTMDETATF